MKIRHRNHTISIPGTLSNFNPFSPRHTNALPTKRLVSLYRSKHCAARRLGGHVSNGTKLTTRLNAASVPTVREHVTRKSARTTLILSTVVCHVTGRVNNTTIILCNGISTVLLAKNVTRSRCVASQLRRHISFLTPIRICPKRSRLRTLMVGTLKTLHKRLPIRICQWWSCHFYSS